MPDEMNERVEFEKWCASSDEDADGTKRAKALWLGWQARAALRARLARDGGAGDSPRCCSCCLVDGEVARKRDMARGGGYYRVVGLRSPYRCAECAESHGVGHRGPRPKCECPGAIGPHVAGSPNGKTSGLGPEDGGSTPPPAATSSAALCDARVVEDAEKALVFLRAAMLENSDGEHPISEYLTRIDDALTTLQKRDICNCRLPRICK